MVVFMPRGIAGLALRLGRRSRPDAKLAEEAGHA
jgi:hypothetical protein